MGVAIAVAMLGRVAGGCDDGELMGAVDRGSGDCRLRRVAATMVVCRCGGWLMLVE